MTNGSLQPHAVTLGLGFRVVWSAFDFKIGANYPPFALEPRNFH